MNNSLNSALTSHLPYCTSQRFSNNQVMASAGASWPLVFANDQLDLASSPIFPWTQRESSFLICQHRKLLAIIFFHARSTENKEVVLISVFEYVFSWDWKISLKTKLFHLWWTRPPHVKDQRQHLILRMLLCKNEKERMF